MSMMYIQDDLYDNDENMTSMIMMYIQDDRYDYDVCICCLL